MGCLRAPLLPRLDTVSDIRRIVEILTYAALRTDKCGCLPSTENRG
jgi:hypothetical protein